MGTKKPVVEAAEVEVKKTRKAPAKPKAEKVAKEPVDRAAAISESWKNPDTHAARSVKSRVKVAGVEYRSVLAAFTELGLPINAHIAFRKHLKAEGKAVFQDENGKKTTFTIVPQAE